MRGHLVPTRVGMILSEVGYIFDKDACPHTRGDDPSVISMPYIALILVPTRVGMILSTADEKLSVKACPHTRGDDQPVLTDRSHIVSLSPHAWG